MKKIIYLFMAITVILLAGVLPVYAHGGGYYGGGHYHGGGHGHVSGGIWIGGPWPWWGPYPYYYPYYYPYPSYYYAEPPVVMQQQYPAYEQEAPQVQEQPYYWYFCPDTKTYYPYVKQCPGGWLKVVPPSNPPKHKE